MCAETEHVHVVVGRRESAAALTAGAHLRLLARIRGPACKAVVPFWAATMSTVIDVRARTCRTKHVYALHHVRA